MVVATAGLLAVGCGPGAAIDPPTRIEVVAAASLADVVDELGRAFEAGDGVRVRLTTGASGVLCEQVRGGMPCDLFIPASPAYIDRLFDAATGNSAARVALARNRIVLVTRRAREPLARHGAAPPADSRSLRDAMRFWKRIAIANPEHAPAGARAREALVTLGAWNTVRSRIVFADDVRMAARYVAQGAADGGMVYRTDATAFGETLDIVGEFPESLHAPIRYEGVVGPAANRAAVAERFLKFMQSEQALGIWRKHGFQLIESTEIR